MLKPNDGRVAIDSFPPWIRAYSVFMAYQVTVKPELAGPLAKYQELIASYADCGVPTTHWSEYDRQFRFCLTSHPDDLALWTHQHDDTLTTITSRMHPRKAATNHRWVQNCEKGQLMTTNAGIAARQDTSSLSANFLVRACLDISSLFGLPCSRGGGIFRNHNYATCTDPCRNRQIHACDICHDKDHRAPSFHDPLTKIPTVPSRAHRPLRAAVIEKLLAKHPGPHLRLFISVTLHRGADLRYRGPQKGRNTRNSQSARIHHTSLPCQSERKCP